MSFEDAEEDASKLIDLGNRLDSFLYVIGDSWEHYLNNLFNIPDVINSIERILGKEKLSNIIKNNNFNESYKSILTTSKNIEKIIATLGNSIDRDNLSKNFKKFSLDIQETNIKNRETITIQRSAIKSSLSHKNQKIVELRQDIVQIRLNAQEKIDSSILEIKNKAEDRFKAFEEKIAAHEATAQKQSLVLKHLHGLEGGRSLAAHYETEAKKELRSATWLRRFVFMLALLILGYAYHDIYKNQNIEIANVQKKTGENLPQQQSNKSTEISDTAPLIVKYLGKISTIIIALGFISWINKEANKHRLRGNFLKNKSISLNSFELYSGDLPSEIKNQLKLDLAKYYLSDGIENSSENDSMNFIGSEILTKIVDKVK